VLTASLMSLRAVLTSSQLRPCLDFEVIGDKEGDASAFRVVFPRVREKFDGQFKVVTGDAGLACRENALLVQAAGTYYLWGLKGNQPTLLASAEEMFKRCPRVLRPGSSARHTRLTARRPSTRFALYDSHASPPTAGSVKVCVGAAIPAAAAITQPFLLDRGSSLRGSQGSDCRNYSRRWGEQERGSPSRWEPASGAIAIAPKHHCTRRFRGGLKGDPGMAPANSNAPRSQVPSPPRVLPSGSRS
jgi:hypothetical protein